MSKNKTVSFRIEEEWLKGIYALAGTFGATPDEAIVRSLPDAAVIHLFFQCRDYLPQLRWDEVADIGKEAIRKYLREKYMEGLEQHLARFGVSVDSSGDEVEAARQRARDELRADTTRPLEHQLARAEADSVYLADLYDAWKQAQAGRPGYTIEQVEVEATPQTRAGQATTRKVWAVLKDNEVV